MSSTMSLERLHQLFDIHKDETSLSWGGECHDCEKETEVIVGLSEHGFSVVGGAVYEPELNKFYLKCDSCFEKDHLLRNYQECDVYSRVVGYLQPVKQWNAGKQSEYNQRRSFNID